jgi:hypothetical protein
MTHSHRFDPAERSTPTHCAECGFEWSLERAAVTAVVLEAAGRLASALGPDAGTATWVTRRPAPGVWSPLEYVRHTGHGLGWYGRRIDQVLAEPGCRLEAGPDWDRLLAESPGREAVDEVAAVGRAARSLGHRLVGLTADDWETCGVGGNGGPRRVIDLARRAAHEVAHHQFDVLRAAPRGPGRAM